MRTLVLLTSLVLGIAAMAGTPPTPAMLEHLSSTPVGFEENKGQVRTTHGAAAPFVRYRLSQGNTQLFLLGNGIAYQFSRTHFPEGYAELMADARHVAGKQRELDALRKQIRRETYRMDMALEGADPDPIITTEGQSEDYTQYYNHGALDVHTYTKLTYHDIYPGIDWVVYTTEKGMKYDFVVRPGADPDRIRMRFKHYEELSVDADGNLIHGNRMGRFTEERPVSFQDGREVRTRYVLDGDVVRFAVDGYERTRELIIDPDLIWGTYYGGGGFEEGTACATSASGEVALAGWTDSSTGIASGGHQNTFGGGNADAFLVVFNSDGVRLWGTYYGGTGNEVGHGCAFDGSGNVFLSGYTESTSGIASAGHQGTYAGMTDAFLVKFSSSGVREWGTYYGGPDGDNEGRCAADASGNVYLTGFTSSSSSIASGGHQGAYGGGIDIFLVKFDANGNRLWGTYYGGAGLELRSRCATDSNGNVYLTGETSSTAAIASGGFLNAFAGGENDLFLVKFNGSGTRQWATYYGGADIDEGGACATDASGNVYLSGTTRSSSGIASGGHQNSYGGSTSDYVGDGLLVKFSSSGARLWATYYGGSGNETGDGCAVDGPGNVYLTGETANSSTGIATDGTHQTVNAGSADAYVVKFNTSGARQWGTYYGGTSSDQTSGCSAGTEGMVHIAGTTHSTSGIAYNGHQNSTSNQVAFLAKFGLYIPPSVTIGAVAGSPFCAGELVSVPYTVEGTFDPSNIFTAELSNAGGSFSSPVAIGTLNGTANGTIIATLPMGTSPGNGYRIRVIASDPDTVGIDNGTNLTINNPSTSCICALDAEAEPNNNAGAANPIVAGVAKSGTMGACVAADNTSDHFSFTTVSQGVLRVQACLSNTGPTALPVTFRVLNASGTTLSTHVLQAGANKLAVAGEFLFPCRGITSYRIAIDNPSTSYCTFYSFTYNILSPLFGNDVEPNNSVPGTTVAHDTYTDGRIQFDGENVYDYFNIVPPTNGLMNIEVQAEHADGSAGTLEVAICNASGVAIQTWNVNAGANGTAATTTVSIPCRSSTTNYNVRFASTTCGVSYRWKYTMTPPHFVNDAEPNNSNGGSIESYDTWYEGQLGFDDQTDDDIYTIAPPINGVMHISVEAEHTGATAGTATVSLLSSTGTVIQSWTLIAGANGIPEDTLVSVTCRSGIASYNLRFSDVTCGVSYRWKYTMSSPHFANDVEPNNSAPGTGLPHDTYTEGQVQFDGDTYDYYTLTPATNGVMTFFVEAEHVGAITGSMELRLLNSGGATIQTWTLNAGANSLPLDTTFSITCRSTVNPYQVRMTSASCGVSYRFKYTMTAPVFAVDLEPNNGPPGTALPAGTYTEGHLAFDAESTYDYYRIEQPANGRVNVEIQAEHVGASPGTMTAALLTTSGTLVQSWNFPVGANTIPITTLQYRTCLTGPTTYDLRVSSSTCGVSYRMKYTFAPPAFSNDTEPNNSTAQAMVLPETQLAQGQLNFTSDNLDIYRANLSGDGILNLLIEAEHAGAETNATMTVEVYLSTSTVVQTWTAPIGANSIPISTVLSKTCMGNTIPYYVRISSSICLTSYRISYTVTPPAFVSDTEPNNGTPGGGGPLVAHDTYQSGHLKFYPTTDHDLYNIAPPLNGVMSFEVQAEHAGAVADSMELRLYSTTGGTIQFWTIPVGPNGAPITSTVSITCRSGTIDYDVRLSTNACGVSYKWKYTMLAPVFANDLEPNNITGGSTEAHDTWYTGQIGFDNQTDDDIYNLVPPTNGVMNIQVEAEHAGATNGTLEVTLLTTNGITIQQWIVPVGAGGSMVSTAMSQTCRSSTTDYDLRFRDITCGTSYRWKYWMSPPVFSNDVEPNNSSGGSTEAHDTWYTGQIGFDNQTDDDIYNLVPPYNGTMNIEVEAENAGASNGTVEVTLFTTTGGLIQQWIVPAGAAGAPMSTVLSQTCRSSTTDYDLRFRDITCGVSYRWRYVMAAPVFANDPEPNNSSGTNTPINLNNAAQTGQIGFDNQTDDDYFGFTHPGGTWSVTVSAEHSGVGAGTMSLVVINNPGTVFGTFTVPVGGSSTPLTNTFTIPSLPAGSIYRMKLIDVTCGVSYRLHCYDTDQDGVCNGSDVCPNGPDPGAPCDDGNSNTANDQINASCVCTGSVIAVFVPVRVFLEGPYDAATGLMNDALRSLPDFPLTDPYPALGYVHTGGGNGGSIPPAVLAITGNNATVDRVLVELRSAADPSLVVASRSVLLQRDGDVVDLDGTSPTSFVVVPGSYYVAVRHRNHLGAMTKDPIMVSSGMALLDFTDPATDTYGAEAQKSVSGSFPAEALWSGDNSFNGELKYVGQDNDRDPILLDIGGSVPTNVLPNVYSSNDCNLDGTVMYVGQGNDRDPILVNIGGSVPTNTRSQQLP